MIKAFNSGRGYTQHGQRIAVKLTATHVHLVDIDRGVDMTWPIPRDLNKAEYIEFGLMRPAEILRTYDSPPQGTVWQVDEPLRSELAKAAEPMQIGALVTYN
jgi:hypothetical protein